MSRLLAGLGQGISAVALLVGASACHVGPHAAAGAGDSLNVCDGVHAYNELAEPVATNHASVQTYLAAAQRVFHRIDTTIHYRSVNGPKREVPAQIVALIKTERSALATESTALIAADTPARLRANETSFTSASDYAATDTGLELWVSGNCG